MWYTLKVDDYDPVIKHSSKIMEGGYKPVTSFSIDLRPSAIE